MADDGPLSEMLEKIPEGQFANWLGTLLYYHGHALENAIVQPHPHLGETPQDVTKKLTEMRNYFEKIAHEKLKKDVPGWIKELLKIV